MSGPISVALKFLIDAGVSNDVLLTAVAQMEHASKPDRSKAAERQARYAAKKKASEASVMTENDGQLVSSSPPSSLSPTPPITTTPSPTSSNQTTRDPSKPSVSRGTRLSADFVPLPNILEMGRSRGLTEFELADELEKFRDWANAATGQVSIKRDWQGAFRNWIKRAADDRKKRNGFNKTTDNRADGFAKVRAVIAEAERRESENSGAFGEENVVSIPRLRQVSS
jgi:hypothetical protein